MDEEEPLGRKRYIERIITTGDEMPDCDPEIFKKGKPIAYCCHGKQMAEDFCIEARARGVRVDWFYGGLRKVPRLATLDDPEEVLKGWNLFVEGRRQKDELG